METIMKIPFLFALLAAIITGLIGISNNRSVNQTCIYMMIAMVIFYFIGTLLKATITGIVEEQNKLKAQAEREKKEKENQERLRIEREKAEKLGKEQHLGKNLDLVADSNLDDGFTPLDLSQAVRTRMKE
ncbi:hypothetical protein Cpap_0610 [Ruminiclostridium papyrosolvens DSM 2782]|uniref:Uncharacterized protein n=1 Tax=Ruminiclostridium papyrosolvens DSM 2782 TaxID=588581 RepID=F1THM2_9FIRM|nr:hypothetical protein [Ruminiclostridium papyrosolvens]EGD46004.1 hypothetical protein Cpap_0610 [Ruminiclostridium papyrosolvens DSM 2782]WES32805.1 hypothetical protein P0092_13675 [Ruminiclostridium papyrosolvens DSM 2782]